MDDHPLAWQHYVRALTRYWYVLVLAPLVIGGLVFAVSLYWVATSPVYEAQAQLLLSRPRYQPEFEAKFKNTPDAGPSNALTISQRLQTLASIAQTGEVEREVQRQLADRLPAEQEEPERLLRGIRVRPSNELLRITARAENPQLAAEVANAWADAVAARVEVLYSANAGLGSLEGEVERARQAYEAADREYSQFLVDNPVEELGRRVAAKQSEIDSLQDQRTSYMRARATALYAALGELNDMIRAAETLQAQLREPTRSQAAAAGDALAVLMLRARSAVPRDSTSTSSAAQNGTTSAPTYPSSSTVINAGSAAIALQLTADRLGALSEGASGYGSDLDALADAMRDRRTALQAEFDQLGRRLQAGIALDEPSGTATDDPLTVALSQAVSDLQRTKLQLAELVRQREALSNQRTVLGTSYTTLVNKAQELRVARATTLGEVSVAERALPPVRPAEPRPSLNALLGAIIGLFLGALAILGATFWRGAGRSIPASPSRSPASSAGATQVTPLTSRQ